MPSTIKLAVIGGDGIGPEVTAEALKVLRAAAPDVTVDVTDYDLGARHWHRTSETLPDAVLEEIRGHDAILLGAGGGPTGPPGGAENSGRVVVREGTEGPYTGAGGVMRKGTPGEIAPQESLNPAFGVERVARYAFNRAASRPRQKLTLVHKTNVLTYAGDLWQRTVDRLAKEFADITVDYAHVDAASMFFVSQPERFDVVVTDNLFGDILTDLGAAVAGGIGLAASGNIN